MVLHTKIASRTLAFTGAKIEIFMMPEATDGRYLPATDGLLLRYLRAWLILLHFLLQRSYTLNFSYELGISLFQ